MNEMSPGEFNELLQKQSKAYEEGNYDLAFDLGIEVARELGVSEDLVAKVIERRNSELNSLDA